MWLLLKKTLLAWFLSRTLGRVLLVLMALLAPVAGILKLIGIPVLIVLGIVLAPALLLLAIIGLPLMLIALVGSVLAAVLSGVLALSVALLKVIVPIVLVVVVVRFVWGLVFGKRRDDPPPASTAGENI